MRFKAFSTRSAKHFCCGLNFGVVNKHAQFNRNASSSAVYDVVVSGGGMVGNAMTASLCKRISQTLQRLCQLSA